MQINLKETADFLKAHDNYYILTHQSPDGDTMGSGFGLCYALRKIGKKANVICSDEFPKRYYFMHDIYEPQKFSPETIVAVDVADTKLLGPKLAQYGSYVDLCIDHHISNTEYAKQLLVYPDAAAACEVIYRVLAEMEIPLTSLSRNACTRELPRIRAASSTRIPRGLHTLFRQSLWTTA